MLRMTRQMRKHHQAISAALVAVALVYVLMVLGASTALQQTKMIVSPSNDRPLRGEVLKVSGRLSTVDGDSPIPLVAVRLQYHRLGEADVVRDVTTVTSNPGGTFEDLVNTTTLLRIGTWVVNASFAAQLGYQSTFTEKTFTIVVQPALSLYVSTHTAAVGENVTFNGLLFACVPCVRDKVTVVLTRPNHSSITFVLPLNATGGPYPGGYYVGSFVADTQGSWFIKAMWQGNDVTLPVQSQVEKVAVETPTASGAVSILNALALTIGIVSAMIAVLYVKRRLRN